MNLCTRDGRPLQVNGDKVYSRSGQVVGKIYGNKVHGPDGRYVGTIDNDRLVFRSTESASTQSSFAASNIAGSALGNLAGSAMWGDEPDIPD